MLAIIGMIVVAIGLIALGPIGWVILGFLLICIAIAKSKNNEGIDTPNELYSQKIKQNDRWLELEFTLKNGIVKSWGSKYYP